MRLVERLAGLVAVGVVVALALAGRAGAVTPGRNGLLLIGASQGTQFSAASAAGPSASADECSPGVPDALWTVRPDGSHLKAVGRGNGGQFSPGGRNLLTWDHLQCSDSESLSLSFVPFRVERLIPHAVGGGGGAASPGPWLGPERPSVFDDSGRYLDALTGRPLLPGASYSVVGTPGEASCDGRAAAYGSSEASLAIDTPVRSGRSVVAARHPIVALHRKGDFIDAQWSADGRYLFYVLHRGSADSSSLWRVDSDGAGRRLLYTDHFDSDLVATVSPNGRWVLLQVLAGVGEELWVIGSDGHGLHPLVVGTAGTYLTASGEWSPRGDRLFVIKDDSTIEPPLGPTVQAAFVIRPDGSGRHVVPYPADPAAQVVWSPNERDLAYGVGSGIDVVPAAGGPARILLTTAAPLPPGAAVPWVSDWQAVPGTGRPFKCLDGQPPF